MYKTASGLERQSTNYYHSRINNLGKRMNIIIPPTVGRIIPQRFSVKEGLGIK